MRRTCRESSENQLPARVKSIRVTDCFEWRFLNFGNPTRLPLRTPFFDSSKFLRATTAFVTPLRKACMVTSWCHGATSSLTEFHNGVNVKGDQSRDVVTPPSSIPALRSSPPLSQFSLVIALAHLDPKCHSPQYPCG